MNKPSPRLLFMMPVYNDWAACRQLLAEIDSEASSQSWRAEILILDDGSHEQRPELDSVCGSLERVSVLTLKRNLGHQRAICVGLAFVEKNWDGDYIVIMDGDGQDRPADASTLLQVAQEANGTEVVFAARTRRSESVLFRLFYQMYRIVHFVLTGHRVRVGNFSVVPFSLIPKLCLFPELWNHYAATVFKSKVPRSEIPIARRARSEDRSKMNFVGLVVHGLSAMSVFGEIIGVRMFLLTISLFGASICSLIVVIAIRLLTDLAIPGWATSATGGATIVGVQSLLLMMVFVFVVLSSRNSSGFLPTRDFEYYIGKVEDWEGPPEE